MAVRLQELSRMPTVQRDRALADLVRDARAPRNGQAKRLDARIREFEMKHGMSSAEMRQRWESDELDDDADFAEWDLLSARDGR